jgi:NADH-quinone oxidoreductase subunit C
MEPVAIAGALRERFADDLVDELQFRGQVAVVVRPAAIVAVCTHLRDDAALAMDYLADLCGIDVGGDDDRFEVAYQLTSLRHRHGVRLKARLPGHDPCIDSVVSVWPAANWFEREVFDMFGIRFRGHPDLRRLLMPDNWEGHPLRRDYPLKGPEGWEYPEYEEAMRLHEHDDEWRVR